MLAFGVGSAAPAAAATGQFGEPGDAAGQFVEPEGVAVDQASGDVYVVDRKNQRVEKFTATGGFLTGWGWGVADGTTNALQTCTTTCFAGVQGSGAGQFSFPQGVAVDNSTSLLDTSVGDVYVVDVRNNRVEKFSPSGAFLLMFGGEVNEATRGNVCLAGEKCQSGTEGTATGQFALHNEQGIYIAVGPTGTVYVGDRDRVQEFSPEGVYQSQLTLAGAGHTAYVAVDAAENVYVTSESQSGMQAYSSVQEYSSAGMLIRTLDPEGKPQSPALDAAGDLFIAENGSSHRIFKYDPSGSLVTSFDSGSAQGMAFDDASGTLYVVSGDTVRLLTPPPPGPLVEPGSESATELMRTSATLNATVNPEGHEASSSEELSYRFEYGETASYVASTPVETSIGGSFEDRNLTTGIAAGLHPRTTYHFRVVATNAAHETTSGPDQTFTTLPPASIDNESASNVAATSATLEAQINPLGSDTEYRFEYDTSAYEGAARHGTSVPIPDGHIAAGNGDATVSEHIQNLMPGTYHYRVVASNTLGAVEGQDRSFTTQGVGESPVLPDGRHWELVSPPDKHGATMEALRASGTATQASEDGEAFTYAANAATEANAPGEVGPEREQVLSARTASGWTSRDIATPHNEPTAEQQTGHESEYMLFSGDLSFGMVNPVGETPLSPETSEHTPYRRDNRTDSYQPLVTAANAPGAQFANQVGLASASPDLSHIVLHSGVSLTTPPFGPGLYEWAEGRVQPVSVLPDGEPAPSAALGFRGSLESGYVRRAISNDGSRIVWESGGHLYMRDTSKKETVQLDALEPGARGGEGAPMFQTASNDGSRVFFTDSKRLTAAAPRGGDLYEFEVTGAGGGRLRDLNVVGVSGIAPGASEDGSYVYIVNGGVLTEAENGEKEKAVAGGNNLYVLHDDGRTWTPTFIAQLSSQDGNDWEAEILGHGHGVSGFTSRVSPDGRWLAFMSERSLTGYDNRDASSGAPAEEVFLYDAGSGHVLCASCNTTGARPAAMFFTGDTPLPLVDFPNVWAHRWVAGLIPGWTPASVSHGIYQSRYLSNGGRLFFDSSDALVPRDVNGQEDVYEYEPLGIKSAEGKELCTESSQTFSAQSGGCVDLISSGTSSAESGFLDASQSGGDVFFLTKSKLVSSDFDTALDVYDAHECSSRAPCFPEPPASPPACASGDSCRAAPSPQPSIFGAPASSTFSGPGNVVPPPPPQVKPKPVKCKRGFVRKKVKGKTRCVKPKQSAHRARHARKSTTGRNR
jgi:hypothetical protein